jgi:ubiquitin C-terminal hydrolase
MLFTIQAYLEDYLNRRNLADSDGYAVRLANLYFYQRSGLDTSQFLRKVRQIRTVLFVNNGIQDRADFEKALIDRLDKQFKKNWSRLILLFLAVQN